MIFKSRLSMFLLTGLFLLLSLFASSCYYSWSMSGEGYEGSHVYLVKVPGRCVDYDYFESQDPLDYLKKTDLLYAYDPDFSGYEVSSERYQASLETYEELNSQGYSIGGKGDGMIWDREERKTIRFALPPGTLFRVTHFWWNIETETKIYADVLNGPLAGKEIEVHGFGRHYFYSGGIKDLFEYPDGRTLPFWQEVDQYGQAFLDPDVVQDLGRLSDEELKAKGLWLEPGTDAALKVAVKPFPEGMDEFVFDGVMEAAQNADVDAQLRLSQCYYEGAGVRKSRASAERWLEAAVEQTQRRDLEFRLAFMYADSWGHRGIRMKKAEKIFRKYAEQGDADAQFCLGLLLECGYGNVKFSLPVDQEKLEKWKESVEWYRKAADQGDARAMRALGMAYCEPSETPWFWPTIVRVDRDMEQAAEWFRKAAELGDFAAQRNLGYLYLHGEGVKKDAVEARKWLEKAAAQGDVYATDLLKDLDE